MLFASAVLWGRGRASDLSEIPDSKQERRVPQCEHSVLSELLWQPGGTGVLGSERLNKTPTGTACGSL